jgi:hypothetical protein|tara:strand:- start:2080 stop:2502 length:423 start_codon:yes stop_codon:yes gene_type:complete
MSEATTKDFVYLVILWNGILSLSALPLFVENPWAIIFLLTFLIPNLLGYIPRGGEFWGRMALDVPFMLLSTGVAWGLSAALAQISGKVKDSFKNYGKTTRSTGTVIGVRGAGLLLGFITSYIVLGNEKMYSHFNNAVNNV